MTYWTSLAFDDCAVDNGSARAFHGMTAGTFLVFLLWLTAVIRVTQLPSFNLFFMLFRFSRMRAAIESFATRYRARPHWTTAFLVCASSSLVCVGPVATAAVHAPSIHRPLARHRTVRVHYRCYTDRRMWALSRPSPNRLATYYRARLDGCVITPFGFAPTTFDTWVCGLIAAAEYEHFFVECAVWCIINCVNNVYRWTRALLMLRFASHHARIIKLFFITIFL